MDRLNFTCGAASPHLVRSGEIMVVARPGPVGSFNRSMPRFFAAALSMSTLFCGVGARAESLFAWVDGRGKVDSALDVADPDTKAKCRLPAETRFRMAPDPDSAASAPTRLLWVTQAAAKAPDKACSEGYGYRARLPDIDSRTYYAEATIGAAVIPFKYYLSGDRSVKSNTTALGYVGLKRHTPGGDYIVGFGAGPSQISVAAPSSGSGASASTPGDTTQAGFTVALVMLGQLKYDSPAQFGLAIGQDRTSKSANWQNNGKWWLGFQVGMQIF